MATKAHLDGNQRYLNKMYRIPVYIKEESREPLQRIAADKGHRSLNAYIKHLLEKDSGVKL